ncbi:hypothetical protein B739_1435 [Riemerella anatipestifer RA-CH-1]|uniref:DNA-directed DNA polymerase family A palm domain-containing protein n=3 Tax=Riemerella anatipestifer TaxID=34085 RepID=J9R6B3_RIEAN|nr:hypothetical protein B739_1435 [Riemerella anatipestifer RA-CH-1]MDR7752763.1 hypothetical protein [Riemerella anatipestifer]
MRVMEANPIIVGSALNPHSNQKNSPSQNAGLVINNGYERRSSLTLYIPENVDIDRLLVENPPNCRLERDYLVYILHLITAIPARKRDTIKEYNGFTTINKKLLQKRIHDYKVYFDYLLQNSIILEDGFYIVGKKSVGYKIRNPSPILKPVIITKRTLIKSILHLHKNYSVKLTEKYGFLKKWFNNNVKVDYEGAIKFLEDLKFQEIQNGNTENINLRYNCRMLPILKLRDQNFSFYVDDSGYRLHTNFTQMKSELRNFCTYKDEKLCAIDVKNCQLYLAISLLDDELFIKNDITSMIVNPSLTNQPNYPIMLVDLIRSIKNEPDVLLFKEWASTGFFYENFGKLLVEKDILDKDEPNLRNKVKEITFISIYSHNNQAPHVKEIRIFKEFFPNVFKVFSKIKFGKKYHNALSLCLQRLESKLVIDKSCRKISQKYPFAPIYTIHDSIVTTERHVGFIKSELYNVLKESIGTTPSLKIERWES